MTSLTKNRKIQITLILIFTCIIVLIPSFILLLASSWMGDEYFQAHAFQVGGWQAFWARLSSWSPRPLSDSILYVYYMLVFWAKKQLSWLFLLTLWGLFLGSIFKSSQWLINRNDFKNNDIKAELFSPLLLTLILFIYFIFIAKPAEIFYWPAGAAAYLITLSGIIINVCYPIRLSEFRKISLLDAFKLIGVAIIISFSSEAGAVFQFLFSTFLLMGLLVPKLRKRLYFPFSDLKVGSGKWEVESVGKRTTFMDDDATCGMRTQFEQSSIRNLFLSLFTSLSLSGAILFLLKVARVGKPEMNSLQSAVTGSFKDSLVLGLQKFFQEIVSLNSIPLSLNALSPLLAKVGFLILLFILFSQAKIIISQTSKVICFIAIAALISTNFVTIFAAYYQFGEICCDRHLHFRAILMGISLLLVALVLASENPEKAEHKGIIKNSFFQSEFALLTMFALTLVLLVNLQFDRIREDLYNFRDIVNTNSRNWLENINPKNPVGTYKNYKNNYASYVLFFYLSPSGIYSSCHTNNPALIQIYMNYFSLEKLYIDPNESSIDFACPPSQSLGYLDAVNGSYGQEVTVTRGQPLIITGWAIKPERSQPAAEVIITVGDENKVVATVGTGQERPDVAKSFNNQALSYSGWRATLPLGDIPHQTFTLKAWAYDHTTKIATPLNNTFRVSVK